MPKRPNFIFIRNQYVRFRYDIFGGLCWFPRGNIYKLGNDEITLFDLLGKPRDIRSINSLLFSQKVEDIINKLIQENLIIESNNKPTEIDERDYKRVSFNLEKSLNQTINKPFWVHIQPFKYCNQNCIHCYCYGGKNQETFKLSLSKWRSIIDKLEAFGVLDVYITGGENFIIEDCFSLAEYITQKGMGIGLSTNGMHVNNEILKKIKKLDIKYIQVSLDSGIPKINDLIRGKKGAFNKTISGIEKLKTIVEPVLNSVINKSNINGLEKIIQLGKSLGISKFKVCSQKAVGRATDFPKLLLSNLEIEELISNCEELAHIYDVEIDYPKKEDCCGSGYSGFSINEVGKVFPCIFGVENSNQCVGDILKDKVGDIWFKSDKLNYFRRLDSSQPCKKCEYGVIK